MVTLLMRVLKRKKGKRNYFYLQYSYRKDSRVITREKYLGKTLPKDVNEIMDKIKKEQGKELCKKLDRIKNNFQKEWKKLPPSAKKRELEEIAIAFTYNTNAIEGSAITIEETREILHDKIAPRKLLRDIKETEAHSEVFFEMLRKKRNISNKLVLQWHKKLFSETKPDLAGKYREYLVRVADHLGADWQDIKRKMKELAEYANSSKINPVELAARMHYRFEKIHPFGDGNGRIGRLLMNYMLWHKGYPIIIIEHKKRKAYYKAFKRDEDYFVKYFLRKYLAVHRKRTI